MLNIHVLNQLRFDRSGKPDMWSAEVQVEHGAHTRATQQCKYSVFNLFSCPAQETQKHAVCITTNTETLQ